MYVLYCDESNLEEHLGDFFIYGGLAIPPLSAKALSLEIDRLRDDFRVPKGYRLKFNPGPPGMTHEAFKDLKGAVIEAACRHGAVLFVSLILHDIATSASEARRNEINRICFHFDCFLNRMKSCGVVLIDRFNDREIDARVAETFSQGLHGLPYSREFRLENILGIHYSAIGQSHFSSLVDIALGTFRFAVNRFTRHDSQFDSTSTKLIGALSPLFYREVEQKVIPEIGLFFSPKIIKAAKYRAVYQGLKDFLEEKGLVVGQAIVAERTY